MSDLERNTPNTPNNESLKKKKIILAALGALVLLTGAGLGARALLSGKSTSSNSQQTPTGNNNPENGGSSLLICEGEEGDGSSSNNPVNSDPTGKPEKPNVNGETPIAPTPALVSANPDVPNTPAPLKPTEKKQKIPIQDDSDNEIEPILPVVMDEIIGQDEKPIQEIVKQLQSGSIDGREIQTDDLVKSIFEILSNTDDADPLKHLIDSTLQNDEEISDLKEPIGSAIPLNLEPLQVDDDIVVVEDDNEQHAESEVSEKQQELQVVNRINEYVEEVKDLFDHTATEPEVILTLNDDVEEVIDLDASISSNEVIPDLETSNEISNHLENQQKSLEEAKTDVTETELTPSVDDPLSQNDDVHEDGEQEDTSTKKSEEYFDVKRDNVILSKAGYKIQQVDETTKVIMFGDNKDGNLMQTDVSMLMSEDNMGQQWDTSKFITFASYIDGHPKYRYRLFMHPTAAYGSTCVKDAKDEDEIRKYLKENAKYLVINPKRNIARFLRKFDGKLMPYAKFVIFREEVSPNSPLVTNQAMEKNLGSTINAAVQRIDNVFSSGGIAYHFQIKTRDVPIPENSEFTSKAACKSQEVGNVYERRVGDLTVIIRCPYKVPEQMISSTAEKVVELYNSKSDNKVDGWYDYLMQETDGYQNYTWFRANFLYNPAARVLVFKE